MGCVDLLEDWTGLTDGKLPYLTYLVALLVGGADPWGRCPVLHWSYLTAPYNGSICYSKVLYL